MLRSHLDAFLQFVRAAPEGAILVHCFEGTRRPNPDPILTRTHTRTRAQTRAQTRARTRTQTLILIHSFEGRNRSAALCVAYLVVEGRMTLTAAVQLVFERRVSAPTGI